MWGKKLIKPNKINIYFEQCSNLASVQKIQCLFIAEINAYFQYTTVYQSVQKAPTHNRISGHPHKMWTQTCTAVSYNLKLH